MEEEEEEKFQQVLDQILLFVCRHLSIHTNLLCTHFRHFKFSDIPGVLPVSSPGSLATVATCHTRGQQSPATTLGCYVVTVLHHLDFPEFLQASRALL